MTDPNMRRIIRVNRLLAELGHADIIEALEQMRGMAEDAARYRWLRLPGSNVPISHEAARDGSVYDAAIDAARAKA